MATLAAQEAQQRRPILADHHDASFDSNYGSFARSPANATAGAANHRSNNISGSGNTYESIGASSLHSGTSTPTRKGSLEPTNRPRGFIKAVQSQYWSYYIPVIKWAPRYEPRQLIGDILAGLTLTCLLVPQSMSYASGLAHLDPVNGLFGVIVPCFVYTFFGTCGQLSVGPEAGLSLILGQTLDKLAPLTLDMPSKALYELRAGIASAVLFEVGLLTFLLGILRLGFLDAVLSRALLRGFITSLGLVIFIEQSIPLLGLGQLYHNAKVGSHPIEKLAFVIRNVQHAHRLTTCISAVCLSMLVLSKVIKPRLSKRHPWVSFIPEILLVVISTTLLCDCFDWDERGVDILGKVSAGAVHAHFPIHQGAVWRYALSGEVMSTAVVLSIIGYVDSIVAAKQSATKYNYAISPNRELTAIGLANLAASFISGTIPGYGSITRSRIAANTGARSPLFSLFVAIFSMLVTFFLLRFLYYLPKAVLGCIIAQVVYSILAEFPEDVHFFIRMRAWTDLSLMALAFFLTLFLSVQTGIVVSVAVSLVLVVRQSARSMGIQIMGRVPGTEDWVPVDDSQSALVEDEMALGEEVPGVLIVRLRETLHFANAGALKDRLRRLEHYGTDKHHPADAPTRDDARVIVFHMRDVVAIDACAMQILEETCSSYASRGVQVYFAHIQPDLRATLDRAKILERIGKDHDKASVKDCLLDAQKPLNAVPARLRTV